MYIFFNTRLYNQSYTLSPVPPPPPSSPLTNSSLKNDLEEESKVRDCPEGVGGEH